MNKLKAGKGALKDYHRYLADEYDDYAEEPEEKDPISHIPHIDKYQMENALQKPKAQKTAIKHTSRWPKYKPDFNIEAYSQGILDGVFGKKVARYLKISDLAKLLSTCRYFSRVFAKAPLWISQMVKTHKSLYVTDKALSSINIQQFFKYLHCNNQYGIVFDTVSLERDLKDEDKLLARNLVDFVPIRSQKVNELTNILTQKGVLTRDLKLSCLKETNQVCVWMSGFSPERKEIGPFVCSLFTKKYDDPQVISKAYFLSDQYFVIELEEKDEEDSRKKKTLEVFAIEAEPEWYEKKQSAFCKQILKETFIGNTESVKGKKIGDFLVFIIEKEKQKLWVRVFDENGKRLSQSEELSIDAGLNDIIPSKSLTTKSSFGLYLLDQESSLYLVDYSLESGLALKKVDQPKIIKTIEEGKEEMQLFDEKEVNRFSDTVKKYQYGTYQKVNGDGQSQIVEYLIVQKEKRFYVMSFDTNELVHCDLPEYDRTLRLFNWTVFEDFLYVLLGNTIQIYQLDLNSYSAIWHQAEIFNKSKFEGSGARWILVNPCVTIVLSTSSFGEPGMNSVRALIGPTQKLLISTKLYPFEWVPDECHLYHMLGHVEKWQDIAELGQEKMECKFEGERLLIQTNLTAYFRDFNVCDARVNRSNHGWKMSAKYDLGTGIVHEEAKIEKKKTVHLAANLVDHENKNHERIKKQGNQNWKSVEKKEETEERIEKKENRKKGDKYYKNVRQGKHREKMFD